MIQLHIDDQPISVQEGTTVLEAANQRGIEIPTLCHHKDLTPFGGCRVCVVEVAGQRTPLASCTLLAEQGMKVRTNSRLLTRYRRWVIRLILSEYHDAGYTAFSSLPQNNELIDLAKRYRIPYRKNQRTEARVEINSDPNPFLWVDMNKCILCARCVRACAEIQGRFVWEIAGRGFDNRIVAGAGTGLLEARCESCGACVAYCPTGALDHKLSLTLGLADRAVTTTCTYCGVGCQLNLEVKNNRIIRVTSHSSAPVNGMHLCVKGRFGYDFVHHPDRLTQPMVRRYLLDGKHRPHRGDRGDWVKVSWDTAISLAGKKIAGYRDQYGPNSIGFMTSAKCTNEENYLVNKLARQVVGTNNIDHCARL
jgi:predicted molibdopterin-dependent oxidoreductase YjgC